MKKAQSAKAAELRSGTEGDVPPPPDAARKRRRPGASQVPMLGCSLFLGAVGAAGSLF